MKIGLQALQSWAESIAEQAKTSREDYKQKIRNNEDLNWLKRLKIQEKLFDDLPGSKGSFELEHLKKKLSHNSLFSKELDAKLKNTIKPLIHKYEQIEKLDKQYRSGINNNKNNNNNNSLSIIDKQMFSVPSVLGAGIGGTFGGPIGAALGGIGGAWSRNVLSEQVARNMNNKDFVEELIRLGRIPPKAKKTVMQRFKDNPQLKFELIRAMYDSNKSKDNRTDKKGK